MHIISKQSTSKLHEDDTFSLRTGERIAFIFCRAEKIDKVETVTFFGFQSFEQNSLNGPHHET
jgi:hypothetical protein